jgi:hypothetical protein
MVKEAVVVGVVAFMIGSLSSPRAANEGETLKVLCKRFEATAGKKLLNLQKTTFDLSPSDPMFGGSIGAIVVLESLRDMVCPEK